MNIYRKIANKMCHRDSLTFSLILASSYSLYFHTNVHSLTKTLPFEFIALSIGFLRKRSRTMIKITPNKMSIVRGINYYVFLKVSHRSKVDGQKFIIFH